MANDESHGATRCAPHDRNNIEPDPPRWSSFGGRMVGGSTFLWPDPTMFSWCLKKKNEDTVDGRVDYPYYFTRFLTSQVVQDFFHQAYYQRKLSCENSELRNFNIVTSHHITRINHITHHSHHLHDSHHTSLPSLTSQSLNSLPSHILHISHFVAGATCGQILRESRSTKCCIF